MASEPPEARPEGVRAEAARRVRRADTGGPEGGGEDGGDGGAAGRCARGGCAAGRVFLSPYATIPVQSSPKRLFCVSSGGRGMSWMISLAVVAPSTRESTKPSAGESVIFWKRRRGSGECWSTRSMSPRA